MKKKLFLQMCLMLVLSLAMTGCGKDGNLANQSTGENQAVQNEKVSDNHGHDHNHDHEHAEDVTIDEWAGSWNNMGAYLDDPEVEEGFNELAEKENTSVEEAKKAYKAKRHCDFDGLVVADGKVTFLDGFKDDGGSEIETVEYKFIESISVMHGSHELTWDVFEANGNASYPVLLMMPVHGEEELTHFHMRYGSDKDELLNKEGWYPTFIKPGSTYEQLNEEIAE